MHDEAPPPESHRPARRRRGLRAAAAAVAAVAAVAVPASGGAAGASSPAGVGAKTPPVSAPPPGSGAVPAPAAPTHGPGDPVAPKVIGGVPAALSDAPWAVAVGRSSVADGYQMQYCGGSLVGPDLVLTAGHCMTGETPGAVDTILGRTRLDGPGGERRHVVAINVHPTYAADPGAMRYDFALLRLASPSAQPRIALPPSNASALWTPGRWVQVAGWGCSDADVYGCNNWPHDLLKGWTNVVADSVCEATSWGFDPASMLCVKDSVAEQVSCQGDSGGGLAAEEPDRWYLVGVVSHGPSGCPPDEEDVYAWVPAAYPWLDRVLGGPYWRGWDIARSVATDPTGWGPYVLDGWGGVHPTGLAPRLSGVPYWRNWDIARGLSLTGYRKGYLLDGWGGLHAFGGATRVSGPYWKGWDIARGVAMIPGTSKGWVLDGWGGLHRVGNASAMSGPYWKGWDIARDVAVLPGGGGGYVLDGWGGLHRFGNAPAVHGGPYWRGWDIARGVTIAPDGTSGTVVDGWGGLHRFTIG